MSRFILCFLVLTTSFFAKAELQIEITKGVDNAIPLLLQGLNQQTAMGHAPLNTIIQNDLDRSGEFTVLADTSGKNPAYKLNGTIEANANASFNIRYELWDTAQNKRILAEQLSLDNSNWRQGAHFISDKIFQTITGAKGIFSTRILYVNQLKKDGKNRYRLELADIDGYKPQVILDSAEPILSPAWAPNGKQIAYVSFEGKRPAIFVQTLANSARKKVASFPGLNGAPSWSPDGNQLALTLSRDGNPEIYLLDLNSEKLTRLSNDLAIDTEPRFTPDGKNIIFTSDRGGKAQVYRLNLSDLSTKRLTFDGNYNGRADISADGRYLALVHREAGQKFQIAVQDLRSGLLTAITQTEQDESPSFAPNGRLLVYSTRHGRYGVLGISSLDGRFQIRLPAQFGSVREPVWSPFMN